MSNAEVPDPTNPTYYIFSDGVELISITENLTGNGAQAVQYITRSTRLDGANKGADVDTQVQDLEKAIWFAQREIDRLKSKPAKVVSISNLNTLIGRDPRVVVDQIKEAQRRMGWK